MREPKLTIIILTFNSQPSLERVVSACKGIASRIVVVDSHSTDGTLALACALGCEVRTHAFDNYSRQRNWAQDYASLTQDDWVLHLDSDEVLSPELAAGIRA